jgi:hypothetical protein
LLGPGIVLFASVASLLPGCGQRFSTFNTNEPEPQPWFVEVAEQVGLNFRHQVGGPPVESYFLPHLMGSGAALFDFDNDGLLDIYLIQNGGPGSAATNRLFRQEKDGHFTDVSKGSGLDIAGHGMGVAIGDVNNDGWPDVLVTEYGGVRLFLNKGNGTFTEVTKEAGLDNPHWAIAAAFVDYDRNGWLDLVVVNYLDYDPTRSCAAGVQPPDYCSAREFSGAVTRLFRNRGRIGPVGKSTVRFDDVTLASGLGTRRTAGLSVVCADFDGDGWPDLFVTNDAGPNRLWINQRDGTFREQAVLRGVAYNSAGAVRGNKSAVFGDLEGDSLFDLFVTQASDMTSTIWKQAPRGLFQDQTIATGLQATFWRGTGFGTVVGDFDRDGNLDLAQVNGRVSRNWGKAPVSGAAFWDSYKERGQLFSNGGGGRFRDISPSNAPFCGSAEVARGLACGTFNGGGALDLLVTSVAGRARLYRNAVADSGQWLIIRAIDPALGGRDAYGAEIRLRGEGRQWVRWINPASSYLCSNDPRAHFGLGKVRRVERILVVWPDGVSEAFPPQDTNQVLVLKKGTGVKPDPD